MRTIFTGLGLVELIAFQKHCENYRFTVQGRDLLATVVQIPELDGQTFLELETMSELDDLSAAHAVLHGVLADLGIRHEGDHGPQLARCRRRGAGPARSAIVAGELHRDQNWKYRNGLKVPAATWMEA
jgi:hypothetical protein